jgi:hypothetical protein
MSGDWMKIELELPDKPEVYRIAGILGLDPDAVVGKLFRVWSWFDKHTEAGNAAGVTYALLDRITGVTGFAEAMALAGWLEQRGSELLIPNFDRHNGKTAKNRALTAKRVAVKRTKCNAESNAQSVTYALPREEKRREERKEVSREVLPDWLPAEKWQDFVDHRKAIRKPMTDKARERMLRHLSDLKAKGHDVLALIDTAIRSGWQDVYEPKPAGQFNSPAVPRPPRKEVEL